MGDFKVGVSVGVYCAKCTLNTGVNTNFEITHWQSRSCVGQNVGLGSLTGSQEVPGSNPTVGVRFWVSLMHLTHVAYVWVRGAKTTGTIAKKFGFA
jgi:hypothetical protein